MKRDLDDKPEGTHPGVEQASPDTVVRCYSVFDKFFPTCGLLDYTEGMYHGDASTPYDVAQKNQINYVLDQVEVAQGTRASWRSAAATARCWTKSAAAARRASALRSRPSKSRCVPAAAWTFGC